MNDLIRQITGTPAGDAIALVGQLPSHGDCAKARDAEIAEKNRKTVLEAIDARYRALPTVGNQHAASGSDGGENPEPQRVQLTCNVRVAGDTLQAYQTFNRQDAEKLGIMDKCQAFSESSN